MPVQIIDNSALGVVKKITPFVEGKFAPFYLVFLQPDEWNYASRHDTLGEARTAIGHEATKPHGPKLSPAKRKAAKSVASTADSNKSGKK